jgi:uncharacterized protein
LAITGCSSFRPRDPDAGEVISFASGPTRCEMTGPTFVDNTLIISVQHPGEDCLIAPAILNRDIEMLDLDGTLLESHRATRQQLAEQHQRCTGA